MGLAIVAGVTLLQYPGNAQTPNGRPGYEQVNDQLAGVEEPTPLGTPSADRDLIANEARRFQLLSPSQTGIDFINSWLTAEKFPDGLANSFICSGVAIGDYDNDGRPDIFLTRQHDGGRLYRNLGEFRFEDVTTQVNIDPKGMWSTGVTFVDLNGDGQLDLYVCGYVSPNRLYINNGGSFTEQAAKYGLDFKGPTVQAAFADYDLDGDLDVYLLTNGLPKSESGRRARLAKPVRLPGQKPFVKVEDREVIDLLEHPNGRSIIIPAGHFDQLLRNDGGHFTGVSFSSGIGMQPYLGLSANWWDYNDDGRPDLYVANDFTGPDHLYVNNGPDRNGNVTFTDSIAHMLPHTPWFSMGSDYGDLNNDGLMDYVASDMAGTNHYRDKLSMGSMSGPDSRAWFLNWPTPPQYMRNCLYVNTGTNRFMEAGFLAGLARSDWTWTVRLADFDNDGRLDVYFTNGMSRDWLNGDLKKQAMELTKKHGRIKGDLFWRTQPRYESENRSYRNLGGLQFEETSGSWGLDHMGVSTGAATGDLDGDGDLDLVVHGFEEPVRLYRNDVAKGHSVLFKLDGRKSNRQALGARLELELEGVPGVQVRYVGTGRGFMSSSDTVVHFGTGDRTTIKRLTIRWPSGIEESFNDLDADRQHLLTEPAAENAVAPVPRSSAPTWFDRADTDLANIMLPEQPYDDFKRQPLIPNKYSQLGPSMAWADIDGDGDIDAYIGRARGDAKEFLVNEGNGEFRPVRPEAFDDALLMEDMGVVWFDADGDSDLDLYVVSGSVETDPHDPSLQDRFYINEGNLNFALSDTVALPQLTTSGGPVAAGDFDRDGDVDLFIGGRIVPGRYPETPVSTLLINGGSGFSVAPDEVAGEVTSKGMVTSALWSDVDDDGWLDLLVTYEWGPVRLYHNRQGRLVDVSGEAALDKRLGWYNSIVAGDLDNDGDTDYVVGNFGLNTKYHPTPENPEILFYADFDGSGRYNIVEAKFEDGICLPQRGFGCSSSAMPFIKGELPTFHEFAIASLQEIYTPEKLAAASRFEVNDLQSGVLLNQTTQSGGFKFEFIPLPRLAQISPIFGCQLVDVDGDGRLDLYVVQNFFGPQRETGNMDGGVSLLLRGLGDGHFDPLMPHQSGLLVAGDAKSLCTIDINSDFRPDFVVGTNNGGLHVFTNSLDYEGCRISIDGGAKYRSIIGTRLLLKFRDGSKMRHEVTAGSGYLSQSPGDLYLGADRARSIEKIAVRWPDGSETSIMDPTIESGELRVHP